MLRKLVLLFFLFSSDCYSQSTKIDSLLSLLPNLASDSTKVQALNQLAISYYNTDAAKTIAYGKQAESLALGLNDKYGLMEAYKMQGIGYWVQGKNEIAHAYYAKGLEMAQSLEDIDQIVRFYNNMAVVNTDVGKYYLGLEQFFDGLQVMEGRDMDDLRALFYQNIGDTYKNIGDYRNGIQFTNRAIALLKKQGNKKGLAVCDNNLGEMMMLQGNYAEAIVYLTRAKEAFVATENKRGESVVTGNLGTYYMETGDNQKAFDELIKAKNLFEEIGNQQGLAKTLNQLGQLSISLDYMTSAKRYLEAGYALASSINLKNEENELLLSLSKYYEAIGDSKQSLKYLNRHLALKDSLFNIERNRQVLELQTLYDSEKKEKENIVLREERQLKDLLLERQESRQQILGIVLVLAVLLITALIFAFIQKYRSNRQLKELNKLVNERNEEIQAQTEELNEAYEEIKSINSNLEQLVLSRTEKLNKSNAELSEFLYRASHDLKGPLMTLQGLTYIGLRDGRNTFEEIMKKVGDTADQMNSTLNNLVYVNTVRKPNIVQVPVDFNLLLERILAQRKGRTKGIKIYKEVCEDCKFVTDEEILNIVLENLLDNALNFADNKKADPYVKITLKNLSDGIYLSVIDNGVGIEEDQLEKIFVMFYRGNISSHGNGLGLYIVKVAVEQLDGKIEINSEVGQGTEVKMIFKR